MKVAVGQVYIKPGVGFPFSHLMQRMVTQELSAIAMPSPQFLKKYGPDFELMINMSAEKGTSENKLMGPTVFKKDKDVEYTVYLPFDAIAQRTDGCRAALEFLFDGISAVFDRLGILAPTLSERRSTVIDKICADPVMLEEPWPKR